MSWVYMHTRPELEAEFANNRHGHGKGARARKQALKRMQAEDRNAATPPERRRRHRIAQKVGKKIKQARGGRP